MVDATTFSVCLTREYRCDQGPATDLFQCSKLMGETADDEIASSIPLDDFGCDRLLTDDITPFITYILIDPLQWLT